jgi:hypothetical protein
MAPNPSARRGGARHRRVHIPLGQVGVYFPLFLTHNHSVDVLSEPDDSYPVREPKKTKKTKRTETSGDIGAFFSKPPAPPVDSGEDIVMNEEELRP